MPLPICLASSSPSRKALLAKLGIQFISVSPDIDERPLLNETPRALVERLAIEKAHQVATKFSEHLIIGSDQVAVFKDSVLGKPMTVEKAIQQLTLFSGQCVTFYTGLALLNSHSNQYTTCVERSKVYFRELTPAQITRYIHSEKPLQCAGSFKSEGLGITLFERLEGDDPNSLIGLPLIQLVSMLRQHGIDLP